MGTLTSRDNQKAVRELMSRYEFTHFLTLTANDQMASLGSIRRMLKGWDARINRFLNGSNWRRRDDARTLWFAFPEKLNANPHWHLVIELDPEHVLGTGAKIDRYRRFSERAEVEWKKVCPAGSCNVQSIEDAGAIWYATKDALLDESVENFVLWREFQ